MARQLVLRLDLLLLGLMVPAGFFSQWKVYLARQLMLRLDLLLLGLMVRLDLISQWT